MLQDQIQSLFDAPPSAYTAEHHTLFSSFKDSLNRGTIRAAEPDPSFPTGWRTNAWVKKGILLGFRLGSIVDMSADSSKLPFFDKSTYPLHSFSVSADVRIVPVAS